MTPAKTKHPRAAAIEVARQMCAALKPCCEPDRLIVAGSLRRRRDEVGDIEIVYVSKTVQVPDGLFDLVTRQAVDQMLDHLLQTHALARRVSVIGRTAWGQKNKLATHVATGIGVDFFATTEEAWFNYLVCRTGPAESNTRLASTAQDRGWKWNPYGPGFTDARGEIVPVKSERDVFELLGLDYLEPWER